jgi:type IV pilus assembly protein PilQ
MNTYWRALRLGGLFLMCATLAPHVTGAQSLQQAAPETATAVSRVEISREGRQTTVRVEGRGGSGQLDYHVMRLPSPPRVVVDVDHARLAVPRYAIASSYAPVRGVRLGQFLPTEVRVVIDLAKATAYKIQTGDDTVSVSFAQPAAASTGSVEPVTDAPVTTTDDGAKGARGRVAQPVQASLADRTFPLPASLTDQGTPLASPVLQAIASAAASEPVLSARSAVVTGAAKDAAAQTAQDPAAPQYTGEPISVNLKDVDLKDFFRLIHEISGLNVVLDPSVHGTVTLVLDQVPWDQALDIVLSNNGLAKELNGNVLRIVTQNTLKQEAQERKDLATAQAEAIPTVTTTRVLSYAKASTVRDTLKQFLSARGEILADDRSNMLIIRDIPSQIPEMDNLLRQLDRKSQQVEIEARVVSASRSFARDIGTQFGFAAGWNSPNSANVIGGSPTGTFTSPIDRSNLPTNLQPPLVTSGSSSIPLISNLPAAAPTSGLSFAHASPNFALDYIITAAESKGVGKLLSSPQLVTQNNAQAIVKQGTKIPIQTTINNTISVQYVDAVLELQVTPQITAEGTVFLDVHVENTSIDQGIPRIEGIPALDTESAETKVLINDGGTVVIGGVMISQQNTNVQQVPLVGSIPLIGHLFKRTSVSVQSQELLFFLTPRILPG